MKTRIAVVVIAICLILVRSTPIKADNPPTNEWVSQPVVDNQSPITYTQELTDLPLKDNLADDYREPHDLVSQSAPLKFIPKQANDTDGDGLSTTTEQTLGTDPNNVDSDCDYVSDGEEAGNVTTPTDSDGDKLIDALESRLVDSNQNGKVDQDDPTSGPQVSCGQFVPFAIANDNASSSRIEVKITGGTNVTAVSVQPNDNYYLTYLKLDGIAVSKEQIIQLYDDGSHGDRVANDKIWTRSQFTSNIELSRFPQISYNFYLVNITNNGITVQIDRRKVMSYFSEIPLGVINQADIELPKVVNTELQLAKHLVNLIHPLGSLQTKKPSLQKPDFQEMSKVFYQHFTDDYDFLLFFPDAMAVGSPYGISYGVKEEIQGIGKNMYDITADYGSSGRLKRAIFMNFVSGGPILHEIVHTWAAIDLSKFTSSQCGDSFHWGITGVGRGQLGGFDPKTLVDNTNGTYTVDMFGRNANYGDTVPYVPMERYLAGFMAPKDVPAITVPINVNCNNLDYSVSGKITFKADGLKTVTIDEIMTMLGGPRIPDYASSQKSFKAAFVIVSQTALTPIEMTFFSQRAKLLGATTGDGFTLSFQEAAGGIATMDTQLPETLPILTPTPTPTGTPTYTPTPTGTPTHTLTPIGTPSPTFTLTPTTGPVQPKQIFLPLIIKSPPPTPTPTATPTNTATPIPTPATNSFINPDFENGRVGWQEYSLQGYPVIVSTATDDVPTSGHSGSWLAWLGGSDKEESNIQQTVTVPSDKPYLSFWFLFGSNDAICGHDFAYVKVNNQIISQANLCLSTNITNWTKQTVDLTAFAGQSVNLEFAISTDSGYTSNFFVDDVAFVAP